MNSGELAGNLTAAALCLIVVLPTAASAQTSECGAARGAGTKARLQELVATFPAG